MRFGLADFHLFRLVPAEIRYVGGFARALSMTPAELADNCGIDLAAAMRAKLARNEERYPVDKARGSNRKYNEL